MADYSPVATTFVLLGVTCCCLGYRLAYMIALFLGLLGSLFTFYVSPLAAIVPIAIVTLVFYAGHRHGGLDEAMRLTTLTLIALAMAAVGAISAYAMRPVVDVAFGIVAGVWAAFVALLFLRCTERNALIVATSTLGAALVMHGSTFAVQNGSFDFLHLIGMCTIESVAIPIQLLCAMGQPAWRRPSLAATALATPTPRDDDDDVLATPPSADHVSIAISTPSTAIHEQDK
ncbi:hypothetical protein SDRG_03833 [Saprolegnia diclina VS20]|uniref:Uncharacterized protein n=1 Tax=Saprolegnia diclina (strain VS20) TaxID=1156394 RepID=T0QXU1_SAPDV|nr:hypothetical protein SDRG_03833 [Saprolegnia diclina VS20]EQC38875.1 hypothetical protein SDRG_03833 [Saprolegnia diclina VS20]|eukprot:XP_008607699.1 hypothetical protein SDRG_03833 [Saprolegnia diclina VS20]